jgi:hypothetical protein
MLSDYRYTGPKGTYWIKFDRHQDGIRASAAGPMLPPGRLLADVAAVVAKTDVEADLMLLAKLQEMGA